MHARRQAAPPGAVRAEFRALGALAGPLVVTQLSQMGMGVADAMMAARVSAADLSGVTLGGNLLWPAMLLMMGIVMAVTPSVSQLHGAGRIAEAGAVVRQALWIAVAGGIALMLLLRNVEPAYRLLGVDARAIPIAADYLRAISFGLVPWLAYIALRCLGEGMSWTRPAMVIGICALSVKVPLNVLFIYGEERLGIPALGGVGCGYATSITMSLVFCAMAAVAALSRLGRSNVFAAFSWPQPAQIGRLLRLGVPIGFAIFLEVSFFAGATLIIGRIGVDAVAGHQVAFNIASVSFMVPLAISMASTVRVGFNVGANDPEAARRAAFVALGVTVAWGAVVAAAMLALRHALVGLYSSESAVVELAAGLLAIGAVFQVFDAAQAAAMGTLRGYKDTRAPMWIAFAGYWVLGLPLGAALCFGVHALPEFGPAGIWWGLVAGLAAVSTALVARLASVSGQRVRLGGRQAGAQR